MLMMGERTVMEEALFYSFRIEDHVPSDHLLCLIERLRKCVSMGSSGAGAWLRAASFGGQR